MTDARSNKERNKYNIPLIKRDKEKDISMFIHGRCLRASPASPSFWEGRKKSSVVDEHNLLKSKHSHQNVGFLPKAALLFNSSHLTPLVVSFVWAPGESAIINIIFWTFAARNIYRLIPCATTGRRFGGQRLIIRAREPISQSCRCSGATTKGSGACSMQRRGVFNNYPL